VLVVQNIRVYTLDRDSLTITWTFEATTADLSSHTVAVLRSESEVGPYTQVSQEMNAEDTNEFEDTGVNLHSKFRDWHYRISVEESGTGDTMEYGSRPAGEVIEGADPGGVVLEAFPDLEALEAIRRFDVTAQEFIGRKVLVLAQRSVGTRCTNCWDSLKRRRNKSNCKTCFGSGVLGGYYRPRESYAVKPPEGKSSSPHPYFELQPNDVVMWFSSRPRLKPRDLVIGIEGRRFRVLNIRRSEKLWALTRQTVQLREISKDQVEYDIPISGWDVDTFTASPARQYIKATDIDSYHHAAAAYGLEDS
jgi:hypothetical protein